MAAVVASALEAHCAAEEALLDAYDLQWKAIDIRLEKLRNECERMILEYEVEVKQQMYLRECEELMRQKQTEHDTQQAALERELADKDERLGAAEEDARELKRRGVEATQKADEEPHQQQLTKKPTVKRKSEKVTEEVVEEGVEKAVPTKPKPVKKPAAKKKVAIEEPVQRPVSPPVYSPEDGSAEEPTADEPQPSAAVEEPAADLSHVADKELLEMLSQDNGYESEDFGDAPSLGLIHPQSPAMLSPKRLKKKAAFEAAALAKNASSPLRGGTISLADRIMNRMKTSTKQPLGEPEPLSDASISPPPMLSTPKRALKRRKTAVLSTQISQSAAAVQAKIAEKVAAASREMEVDMQTRTTSTMLTEKEHAQPKKNASKSDKELQGNHDSELKTNSVATKKKANADKSVTGRKSKKGIDNSDEVEQDTRHKGVGAPEAAGDVEHEEGETSANAGAVGAVTGRSKARQTAKRAALRAAAVEEEDDVAGFPDIKTPKVPRKKMGVDGKKKQISALAAKRAEFQQVLNDSVSVEPADERPMAAKKRRRQDDAATNKEPAQLEFHTPKAKTKKPKITRSAFPNDELNIMKSPVPLLRAKIAEKKKKEEEEAKRKTNKRTLSERDAVDEEEPDYGSPAAAVPAISFPTSKKGPEDIAAAASDYASRWINSGLVTRAKKNAVKSIRKPATKSPKPAALWGAGPSFFDAFVNTSAPAIPRLKSTSAVPKN